MTFPIPHPKFQAFDGTGSPLVGGKLYTYESGTSTPLATFSDPDRLVANSNPVILDHRGEATIYVRGSYKFVLKDSNEVTLWTVDEITSYPDAESGYIFYPDSTEPDQGAVSGGNSTVKDIIDFVGTSKNATIIFQHTGDADTTPYVFQTSETIPSNFRIRIEKGAIITDDANNASVTFHSPEQIVAGERQQIFDFSNGTGAIGWTVKGTGYPEWWGAVYETTPTGAQNTINHTSIQAALNSGLGEIYFNNLFTVDDVLTYPQGITLRSIGYKFRTNGAGGVNFKITASGDTMCLSPNAGGESAVFDGIRFEIDSGSDLGTSGWEIVILNHWGRFSTVRDCFLQNLAGSDNGGGNYYSVGIKHEYNAANTAYAFEMRINNNLIQQCDTDLWLAGDDTVGSDLGLVVGHFIIGNSFGSVNTSNTNQDYANVRIDAGRQITLMGNTYNGNGMSGGTGMPNVTLSGDTRTIEIIGGYWEGGPSGRSRIVFDDETDGVLIVSSGITMQEIDQSADSGYGRFTLIGSSKSQIGGSKWGYDNRYEDINESREGRFTNFTFTAADSGKTIWTNVDGVVGTLPATSTGLTFRFQNLSPDGTVEISLSPQAADMVIGTGSSGVNDKDRTNTKATSKFGDYIEVTGDGNDGWIVTKQRGVWDIEP